MHVTYYSQQLRVSKGSNMQAAKLYLHVIASVIGLLLFVQSAIDVAAQQMS